MSHAPSELPELNEDFPTREQKEMAAWFLMTGHLKYKPTEEARAELKELGLLDEAEKAGLIAVEG
jgi:hypothetical protein